MFFDNPLYIILFLVVIVVIVVLVAKYGFGRVIFGNGAAYLTLFTQGSAFEDIMNGSKKVEARLGSLENFKKYEGKSKIKILGGPGKKQWAKLKSMRHYNDLETFIKKEGAKNVCPKAKNDKEAREMYLELHKKDGSQIYSEANIAAKGGIVAFEFEVLQ